MALKKPHIWWIASYPKSGNTWIRAFITAYFTGKLSLDNLIGMQDVGNCWVHFTAHKPLEKMTIAEQTMLRPAWLLHVYEAWKPNNARLWIKTHCANESVAGFEFIPRYLCEGVVCIVRDPRSIAPSYADHMGISIDEAIEIMGQDDYSLQNDGSFQWTGSWSQNVKSWLEAPAGPHNIKVFRYEAFKRNPERAFRELIEHVAGPEAYDEEQLVKAIRVTSFDVMQSLEEELEEFDERSSESEKFFRRGSTDWSAELTEAQARQIEDDHWEMMELLGYV